MIIKATRKSPSGVHRMTYRSHNCMLSFTGFPDIPVPGKIEHEKELLYAPTAAVMFDKEISAWQINLTLPSFPVFPEDWPRIKSATEDMLALWEEVRGEHGGKSPVGIQISTNRPENISLMGIPLHQIFELNMPDTQQPLLFRKPHPKHTQTILKPHPNQEQIRPTLSPNYSQSRHKEMHSNR